MKDFIHTVQRFVARESVTVSAMRNQGEGVLGAVQRYLDEVDLLKVETLKNEREFIAWLDEHTESLLCVMPVQNKPWGAARKAMNLFLRGSLYNRYLSEQYHLDKIESYLEIPLDSAVAKGLQKIAGRGILPQWPGLRWLSKEISIQYQSLASKEAGLKGAPRVHLDMYLWLANR